MCVPTYAITHDDFDKRHPGLDQASSHQAALSETTRGCGKILFTAFGWLCRCSSTIGVADFIGFTRQIERLFLLRVHQFHCPVEHRSVCNSRLALVRLMKRFLQLLKQIDLTVEYFFGTSRFDVVQTSNRVADAEGLSIWPEEARTHRFLRSATDGHEIRQRHITFPQFVGDNGPQTRERDRPTTVLVTGVHVVSRQTVIGFLGAHPTQDRSVLHEFCELREVFTNLNACH